jgi:hypothetical protein
MVGLVIVAGVAIIGAPVAGLAYVYKDKGPARSWLAAAVLIICSGGSECSVGAAAYLAGRGWGQVKAGDLTRVRRIIMLGIDINARDEVASKYACFNFRCSPRALG